jgi:glycosyltransferase involved in cell wall biosynthesis
MRRLHVIHYPIFGGPHNEALRLNEVLAGRGWDTTVLIPDEPGNAFSRLQDGGVNVVTMPLGRVRALKNPRAHLRFGLGLVPQVVAIRRLIRELEIDLVQIGGLVNPHAAIAARLEKIPLVWQIVDSRTPRLFIQGAMPLVRRLSDSVMFDGQGLVDIHCGSSPLRVPSFVYYPPVDTERFAPSEEKRKSSRREFGIPEDALVIGMVANWNPQKGIEYFVRAAGEIYREHEDIWFLTVGAQYATHKAYTQQIQDEVRLAGIPSERFIVAGERNDVESLYPAMDIKLITSVPLSEGTTTTAMEALACGIPVVATDVGAVREVVRNDVTGYVVPPLEPSALALAVARLIDDPARYNRIKSSTRKESVTRFDVAVCAQTHLEAFEAAIEHKRSHRRSLVRVG